MVRLTPVPTNLPSSMSVNHSDAVLVLRLKRIYTLRPSMHRFLLHRISVKYGRIFALNSALQESRLATLSIQILFRRSTSLLLTVSTEPFKEDTMPNESVLWTHHPVPLVGEVEKS
jgi:hypothetical protein